MSSPFAPPAIALADLPVARAPQIGANKRLYFAAGDVPSIGVVKITGVNTCTWTPASGVTMATGGVDLVACVKNQDGLKGGSASVVVTIAGIDGTGATISGVATFAPPSYASNALNFFRIGFATDAAVTAGAKFKGGVASTTAVTGVTVTALIDAQYAEIEIFAVPALTFYELPGVDDFTAPDRSAVPLSIPQGSDGSAWQVLGRSRPGEFSFTTKSLIGDDDATKLAGLNGVLKATVLKADRVQTNTRVFLHAAYSTSTSSPDGDGVATISVSGKYERELAFIAPGP